MKLAIRKRIIAALRDAATVFLVYVATLIFDVIISRILGLVMI